MGILFKDVQTNSSYKADALEKNDYVVYWKKMYSSLEYFSTNIQDTLEVIYFNHIIKHEQILTKTIKNKDPDFHKKNLC